jgi:hypothetical protein
MAADVERVVDGWVAGEETLRGLGRSKALHLPLSSSERHVRTLSWVVQRHAISRHHTIRFVGSIGAACRTPFPPYTLPGITGSPYQAQAGLTH